MMADYDASFLVSGEVLGQRPMSQRRDTLRIIERDSDNDGLLLRPLSAKRLPPTKAETEGWIDRESLLDFSGRGRSMQIKLAKQFGIEDFPSPAGGCLLADPVLSSRIEKIYSGDLVIQPSDISVNDARLLLVGRQFELSGGAWLIVGRNEKDNIKIESLAGKDDLLLRMVNRPGPTALLRNAKNYVVPGDVENTVLQQAAGLVVRYGKKMQGDPGAEVQFRGLGERWQIVAQAQEGLAPWQ